MALQEETASFVCSVWAKCCGQGELCERGAVGLAKVSAIACGESGLQRFLVEYCGNGCACWSWDVDVRDWAVGFLFQDCRAFPKSGPDLFAVEYSTKDGFSGGVACVGQEVAAFD